MGATANYLTIRCDMAGLLCAATTPAIPVVAGVPKTLLLLTAPANQRLSVVQFGLTTDISSPLAQPSTLTIYRATTSGTMTSTFMSPSVTVPWRSRSMSGASSVSSSVICWLRA